MTATPTLPAPGQAIKTSRTSCAETRLRNQINICKTAIDTFLSNLDQTRFERLKAQHGVDIPLTFPSLESEVSFLTILSVLNTLSAYRAPFHAATGKGAYQNVIRLCVRLYERYGEDALNVEGLMTVNAEVVADLWGLGKDWPVDMREPIDLVVNCCFETGKALRSAGYETPGQLVLQALKDGEGKTNVERAEQFIFKIISTLPPFYDGYSFQDGSNVYLFKKAYFLLLSLFQRFPNLTPNILLNDALPMFVDNVLPTMCVHLGLLDLSQCSEEALVQWGQTSTVQKNNKHVGVIQGPILTISQAYIVRAAALDAGVKVVQRARDLAVQQPERFAWLHNFNEVDLDGYLWSVAKDDPELRSVPRMVEKGTIMY